MEKEKAPKSAHDEHDKSARKECAIKADSDTLIFITIILYTMGGVHYCREARYTSQPPAKKGKRGKGHAPTRHESQHSAQQAHARMYRDMGCRDGGL